jgi:hypothetical protein
MKQTRLLDRAQEHMQPGVITLRGFLGRDTRKIGDILIADDAAVRRLGMTHAGIARRMRELSDAGRRGLGEGTRVEDRFEVRVDSVRGKLPCPFGDPGVHQKTNTTVRNLETGEEIVYTDLNIHMIEAHGFYEGAGSEFRQDPARLVRVLDVPQEDE